MRQIAVFLLLGFLFAEGIPSRGAVGKEVVVPRMKSQIKIDGRLSELAWTRAGQISSFKHYLGEGDIKNQTKVRLLFDDKALYIAFTCNETNMKAVKALVKERDGNLWNDDCVEVFLDIKGDRLSYLHFILNVCGTQYDAIGNNPHIWNPRWEAEVCLFDRQWNAEIKIPFSELGLSMPPKPGAFWYGNFCREEQPSKELSCWLPTMGGFDAPGYFGKILFSYLGTDGIELAKQEKRIQSSKTCEYLVWETTPWRHFSANEDTSSVVRDTASIDVFVLAGQTESKALMVSNFTDETLAARLIIEGFEGVMVEILIPTFVRTADGRPFPDALVPPDPIGQIIIPPGETRQVWLNIKGVKGGEFEGELIISPLTASKADKRVKFNIHVVSAQIEMPRPLAFTWDFLGDAVRLGLEKEYIETMVDHGIRVFMISGLHYMPRPKASDSGEFLEPVDWGKFRRQVELVWKPGRKLYINLDIWEKYSERPMFNGRFGSPGWCVAFKKIISEMIAELAKLGLSYDDYVVNPLDESIDNRFVTIARLVKEVDPKVQIVEDTVGSNLAEVKVADKYVDWWIPHFKSLNSESAKDQIDYIKATGEPVGFYFYSEGANEKAQDSYSHYLWKFWWAYSQGLNGIFGYWTATQHYGDPWNRHQTKAAYDPSLFYYGNGCVITGRRWEAWRRGIEDYALLELCRKAGVDKTVISSTVKSVLDSPNDPTVADRARQNLVRLLASKY